jgi:hypothetical protein
MIGHLFARGLWFIEIGLLGSISITRRVYGSCLQARFFFSVWLSFQAGSGGGTLNGWA